MDEALKLKAEQLAGDIAARAQTPDDLNGLIRTLMKSALQRMLGTELHVHLGRKALAALPPADGAAPASPAPANRRDGHSQKTARGELGEITPDTPRDRNGTSEPQRIAKHQRRLAGSDEKILAPYAKGMTTRDVQDVVKELYGVDVPPALVSEITADLDAEVTAWRQRRLDPVWPIVYLDGIVVPARGDSGRVSQHTMSVAIGVKLPGKKELLGLWLGEAEGAKFWLSCLTDLKNRGLQDIFIVCVDGLTGFPEAVRTACPRAGVQLCIVHLVRAALKYVMDKDSRLVAADLKKVYQSATAGAAEAGLGKFAEVWGAKYPTIVKQWRLRWTDIIALLDFPPAIRKAIGTTKVIESVNGVIRKFRRDRKPYPTAGSALKLV
jgi:putative transposase